MSKHTFTRPDGFVVHPGSWVAITYNTPHKCSCGFEYFSSHIDLLLELKHVLEAEGLYSE